MDLFPWRKRSLLKPILSVVSLVAVVAVAVYFSQLARENEAIRLAVASYGYIGIFIVSVISGFNLAVPLPAISFLPLFLESGLGFWPTILLIAAGTTFADVIAYFLGRAGREFTARSSQKRMVRWIEKVDDRYPWAPLVILFFFVALVPLPNEIIAMPLGFLGYRFSRVIPVVLLGNLCFNLLYASGIVGLTGQL